MTPSQLFEQLKDYYCIVKNQAQAEELHELCKKICPDLEKGNLKVVNNDLHYVYFVVLKESDEANDIKSFVNDRPVNYTSKHRATIGLPYNQMIKKLKNMQSKPQTVSIEFTVAEAIALFHLDNYHIVINKMGEDGRFKQFIRDNSDEKFLYDKTKGVLNNIGIDHMEIDSNSLQNTLNKYNNIATEFPFKNGLNAKYENNLIKIGCHTYSPEQLKEKLDAILNLGLDEIKIEGYSFEKLELIGLKNWLKSL